MTDPQPRKISDVKTMRALAHPVRLALLEALRTEGELTASRAAELLGDSPGNMSWHLQTLAKYGFVEETGNGKGRSRPWRRVPRSFSFDSTQAEPETAAAGDELEALIVNRAFEQLEAWRVQRHDHPDWSSAAFTTNVIAHLTPAELTELSADVLALLSRYDTRDIADRPADAKPVKLFAAGHPLLPPAGE